MTPDDGIAQKVYEKSSILERVGMRNGSEREQVTGIADDEDIVDPHTGRAVSPGAYKKASGESGELSSLQP